MRRTHSAELGIIVFGCVAALVAVPFGLYTAYTVANRQPMLALIIAVPFIVLPVIATARVAFQAGYEIGRESAPAKTRVDVNSEKETPPREETGIKLMEDHFKKAVRS